MNGRNDSKKFRIENSYPIIIPDTVDIQRTIPESIKKAYSGRLDRFDYKTVFYDIFSSNQGIRLVGPPLSNLYEYVSGWSFKIDGQHVVPELNDLMRKQDSRIPHNDGSFLSIDAHYFEESQIINKYDPEVFSGMNVLLTINKNNSITWIVDWVNFYVKVHGINAILLYDTGSILYTAGELLTALRSINGLEAAIIVRWPFKHGPFREKPGVDASANYSQVVMLTHAKEKYLSQSRSVIHCDVDELIYSISGEKLCDEVQVAPYGVVLVSGTWIESATTATYPYRHLDFRHVHAKGSDCFPKWCVSPMRLPPENNWQVHAIWGIDGVEQSTQFRLAHFRGINTNWREKRAVYDAPASDHVVFQDIESYIVPHLAGQQPYQVKPRDVKGIEMAIAQNIETVTESGEMKPSLDPGGLEALTQYLSTCSSYLEYGCGGSTVLAANLGVKRIIAVDTASEWLESVDNATKKLGAQVTLKHCDLGPVKAWGYPVDKQHIDRFHRYAIAPWDEARASGMEPQVVLIDGRFRVACFLYSLMAAKPGTAILFDDYINRPHYHVVEEYCKRQEERGRMGVFLVPETLNYLPLTEAFAKYSIIES